jgi:hypothetical protein
MAAAKGWLPATGEGVLAMARVWTTPCLSKMAGRGAPQAAIASLRALSQAADGAGRLERGGPRPRFKRAAQGVLRRADRLYEGLQAAAFPVSAPG